LRSAETDVLHQAAVDRTSSPRSFPRRLIGEGGTHFSRKALP
jgi:hypothetical protein